MRVNGIILSAYMKKLLYLVVGGAEDEGGPEVEEHRLFGCLGFRLGR